MATYRPSLDIESWFEICERRDTFSPKTASRLQDIEYQLKKAQDGIHGAIRPVSQASRVNIAAVPDEIPKLFESWKSIGQEVDKRSWILDLPKYQQKPLAKKILDEDKEFIAQCSNNFGMELMELMGMPL